MSGRLSVQYLRNRSNGGSDVSYRDCAFSDHSSEISAVINAILGRKIVIEQAVGKAALLHNVRNRNMFDVAFRQKLAPRFQNCSLVASDCSFLVVICYLSTLILCLILTIIQRNVKSTRSKSPTVPYKNGMHLLTVRRFARKPSRIFDENHDLC